MFWRVLVATMVLAICLSQVYLYLDAKATYERGGLTGRSDGPTWGFVDYGQFVAKQDKESTKSLTNEAFLLGTFVSGAALAGGALVVHGLIPYLKKKNASN